MLDCNLFQGRQTQGYAGSGGRGNATSTGVNKNVGTNTTGQAKVIRCYNCQCKDHMARQCTKPKRPKNLDWFKEKMLIAQALESGVVLDEEHMAFLVDNGDTVAIGQDSQELITITIFQTDILMPLTLTVHLKTVRAQNVRITSVYTHWKQS
ncbi:retrovirus-related pol polyprotein from transposon TNT 1-94 [Tanacetum coccineum]